MGGGGGGSGREVKILVVFLVPIPALVLVLFDQVCWCPPTIGFRSLFLFHGQLVGSMRCWWSLVVGFGCTYRGSCCSLWRILDLWRDVRWGNIMDSDVAVDIVVAVVGIGIVAVAAAAVVVDVGGSIVPARLRLQWLCDYLSSRRCGI